MMQTPEPSAPRWITRLGWCLREYFLVGLISLFPVAVTLYVLAAAFRFADGLLGRPLNRYWAHTYGYELPGLGLVLTALLVVLVGMFSSHVMGRWLIRRVEVWLARVPLVRQIYQPIKQVTAFLAGQPHRPGALPRVVLVQYPRAGLYAMALVTNEVLLRADRADRRLLTMLMSHAHSPFTSPLVLMPREDVIPLEVSLEELLTFAVSAGVVAPPFRDAGAIEAR